MFVIPFHDETTIIIRELKDFCGALLRPEFGYTDFNPV